MNEEKPCPIRCRDYDYTGMCSHQNMTNKELAKQGHVFYEKDGMIYHIVCWCFKNETK